VIEIAPSASADDHITVKPVCGLSSGIVPVKLLDALWSRIFAASVAPGDV